MKCKGDTCTDSGAVPITPRGVQPSSKGDIKEESLSCKPSASVSGTGRGQGGVLVSEECSYCWFVDSRFVDSQFV